MSSTPRTRKYREKLKLNEELYKKHLEKERERDKIRRQNKKITLNYDAKALKLRRLQDRERQRRCREKRKASTQSQNNETGFSIHSYKSSRSLGKAVSKSKKALPSSPRKRMAVVKKLIMDELPAISKCISGKNIHKGGRKLDENTIKGVLNFYLRDDVSRQEPGRKDAVSVKNKCTGEKEINQKRIMIMTVSEAYEQFIQENPRLTIKKSKFFELRPQHVLPVSAMPHNVCICKYHSNMQYLVDGVTKESISFPNHPQILLQQVVCTTENYSCMSRKCKTCVKYGDKLDAFFDEECLDNEMKWKQWKDSDGRQSLSEEVGTVRECLQKIKDQLPYFIFHCYVKKQQANYFEDVKSNINSNTAVLQVDFAENYTSAFQDETQSAHWNQHQITIFTAVAWLKDDTVQSFAVISDDLNHNKYSVWVFLKAVLKELVSKYPDLKCVNIFSDGCAGQFKNRFTLLNLTYLHADLNITGKWNFFATSHGKGAVDGVGGAVKRGVWRSVKSRKTVVNSASDFFQCAKSIMKGVSILFVSSQEVICSHEELNARWENVQPIPGLHRLHSFAPLKEDILNVSITSCQDDVQTVILKTQDIVPKTSENISCNISKFNVVKGDFVLTSLEVDGKQNIRREFYAEVMDVDLKISQVMLKFMKSSGNTWIWPKEDDVSFENTDVIICKVRPPKLLNNRGQFVFK